MHPGPFIVIVVLPIAVYFLVQYARAGSALGALAGGRLRETVGETVLNPTSRYPSTLRVHLLDPLSGGEPVIILTLTRPNRISGRLAFLRLERDQAEELVVLLGRATRSGLTARPGSGGQWQ